MTAAPPPGRLAPVTASMMRDMVSCEHRIAMDLHGDPSARDPVSAFTAMLWDEGIGHEAEVLADIAADAVDLRGLAGPAREELTAAALAGGRDLVLGARIRHADLLGDPDLLRREDGAWVAGDVKSGAALAGGRPRAEYAAQVAHYGVILERNGLGDGRAAFILDRSGAEVRYKMDAPAGPRSPSPIEAHAAALSRARAIRDGAPTRPALSADCKGCHWKSACRARLVGDDDPTLVAELGRRARDALTAVAPTVAALARLDPAAIAGGIVPKVAGVGAARLATFAERARLLADPDGRPYARAALPIAARNHEFFLDIEADPLDGDLVYLHGVLERRRTAAGDAETFHAFFADNADTGERDAFAAAVALLRSAPSATVYVYSAYERTSYRRLRERHPKVCEAEEIEALFDPARTVDLLTAVVRPLTEWPASDRSIKTLARQCGFDWRDQEPSGAASIEWFRSFRATGDPATRERIVRYNEDDCIATRVLLDALLRLPVGVPIGTGAAGPAR